MRRIHICRAASGQWHGNRPAAQAPSPEAVALLADLAEALGSTLQRRGVPANDPNRHPTVNNQLNKSSPRPAPPRKGSPTP